MQKNLTRKLTKTARIKPIIFRRGESKYRPREIAHALTLSKYLIIAMDAKQSLTNGETKESHLYKRLIANHSLNSLHAIDATKEVSTLNWKQFHKI